MHFKDFRYTLKRGLRISSALLIFCLFILSAQAQPLAKHVIFIGLDGWAAHDFDKHHDIPNIRMMMQNGSYTLHKRAVLPSASGINWASIFMGVSTAVHGFTTWNCENHEIPYPVVNERGIFPTIFSIIREKYPKAETGCTFDWEAIKYIIDTAAINYVEYYPGGDENLEQYTDRVIKYIKEKKPMFFVPYFGGIDEYGHAKGWYSPEYYDYVARTDKNIGRIIQALKDAGIYDDTIIVVTSDHGGHDHGHGTVAMEDVETPLIIFGKKVKKGYEIKAPVVQYDMAATFAYILGIDPPQVWRGKPVKEAFK